MQRVLERCARCSEQPISRLADLHLTSAQTLNGRTFRASRERTLLQMAHYWRLLQACGHAPSGAAMAGVIGTDELSASSPENVVSWVDLNARIIRTFARTSRTGTTLYSALQRYDHEHRFRVHVAQLAQSEPASGSRSHRITPIVEAECDYCVWWKHCRSRLDDEDISLRIHKSRLDVREISTLSSLGIYTIQDLAEVDIDQLLPGYLPAVAHRHGAESRLRLAARRAKLMVAGIEVERITTGPISVPAAELEIDLDIETSQDGRTYLWGLLITDHATGTATYRAFARFSYLDDRDEVELLDEFARFLTSCVRGRDALIFHYSDYEKVFLTRLAKRSSDPAVAELVNLMPQIFVDLFPIVKKHFFGTHGLGLKAIARAGAGFSWRDDEPGGLNSQTWFTDAVEGESEDVREAARLRVLEYNEDDVRATKVLRQWLRELA